MDFLNISNFYVRPRDLEKFLQANLFAENTFKNIARIFAYTHYTHVQSVQILANLSLTTVLKRRGQKFF